MPEVNSTWRDYSGHGNDGTIIGATKIYNARFGVGLLFDGINDYVDCGNHASVNITDAITICLWIKPNTIDAWVYLVAKGTSGTPGFRIMLNSANNTALFQVYTTVGAVLVTTADALPLGEWSYIVGTYDKDAGADNLIIYMNTIPRTGTNTGTIGVSANSLRIGGRAALYFDGVIDEVSIYNRALAPWEIKALYEQGKPGGT